MLDLQNPNNWENRWNLDAKAEGQLFDANGKVQKWTPIPEQICPLLLHTPFVCVFASSTTKRPNWHYAGRLTQKMSTGIIVGGIHDAIAVQKQIFFDRLQLIQLADFASDFALSFKPPFWLTSFSILVWEFTGQVTSVEQQSIAAGNAQNLQGFLALQSRLVGIETKVDSLV